MNWKEYEDAVCDALREMYPDANIQRDVKLMGKESKTKRQIDILVEYYLLGKATYIIVDTKCYAKAIDVKDVDSFVGMVEDVGAVEGILVTEQGYSPAAILRAYNARVPISLEIYSPSELKDYQGFMCIVHSGIRGVALPAPFGWLIDSTVHEQVLATLYQRGKTYNEASEKYEFMYVNIYNKTGTVQTIEDLVKHQNKYLKKEFDDPKFTIESSIRRKDGRATLLRKAEISAYPALEYTGFIDFEDYIFFCVLFTPEVLQARNVRKIQSVIELSLPIDMTPAFVDSVDKLEEDLQQAEDDSEKAHILFNQGKLLRQIKRHSEADAKFNSSLSLTQEQLQIDEIYLQKSLNTFQTNQNEVDLVVVLSEWLDSQFINASAVFAMLNGLQSYGLDTVALKVVNTKLKSVKKDTDASGLIQYQLGCYFMTIGNNTKARQAFDKAKTELTHKTPLDDEIFDSIEQMLESIN